MVHGDVGHSLMVNGCNCHGKGTNIIAKELLPIVLSTAVWGPQLRRHQVLYQCDNSSVVAAIKKGSARDVVVMQLLGSLWFLLHIMIYILYAST